MRLRLAWIPYFVLAISLLISGAATTYVARTVAAKDQNRFASAVEMIQDEIDVRFATYMALLHATCGLFAGSERVTREGFHRFVEKLNLRKRYSGVEGIGFSLRIAPAQREEVSRQMKAWGFKDFRIWPENEAAEKQVVVLIEPLDRRNAFAIGFDMASEATRRAAMDKACEVGDLAMSGRVTLAQEIDEQKQPGFLFYDPVYRSHHTPAAVSERREDLEGFVYIPFRAGDLLSGFNRGEAKAIHYAIYDGAEASPETLLYESSPSRSKSVGRPAFSATNQIEVARRRWTMQLETLPGFDSRSDRELIPLTAGGGLLASALLFAVTLSQARAQKAAERTAGELKVSRQEAENANQLKDQFLATVSHELRTPLNAILGWTHLLLDEDSLDHDTRKGLEVIERNARSQTELVDELLDVSRIISGRLRLELETVDFEAVIREALETVQPSAQTRHIHLDSSFEAGGAQLTADPGRLRQIVWNLLANAIKFTPPDGRVTVRTRRLNSALELQVTDTGTGIRPDFLPDVFTPFRQADSSSTHHHGGLGLGLAIVRHLVELHGGTITLTSGGDEKGTTSIVSLPGRPMHAGQAPKRAAAPVKADPLTATERSGELDGIVTLVVDDEPDARDMMRKVLLRREATVFTASSCGEALDVLERAHPDVIISDLAMPGEDGYAFIRKVRERSAGRSTPAIAVTALATRADRDKALNAGFQRHLAKPVDPAELYSTVATLAASRDD